MESRAKVELCNPAQTEISTGLQRMLRLRGIHWIVTRYGGRRLRSLSFDEKFKSGDWNFSQESPDLVNLVERYCAKGHVLTLGCGRAPIAGALAPNSYESFLGVDISREAIVAASKQTTQKIHFEFGDMVEYQCSREYNVIFFSDSLYYVPYFVRKKLLVRLRRSLTPQGRFVVTIAQPDRYVNILKMIRRNFIVEVDRQLQGSKRYVLVFF